MELLISSVRNIQARLTVSKILHICMLRLSLSTTKICIKTQRLVWAGQSHTNTINQADTPLSDIWNAAIKNVNIISSGEKENLSGRQIRINRICSRKKLRKYFKVVPVTGDRGIVLVLRGEFGLAKKPTVNLWLPVGQSRLVRFVDMVFQLLMGMR